MSPPGTLVSVTFLSGTWQFILPRGTFEPGNAPWVDIVIELFLVVRYGTALPIHRHPFLTQ